MLPGSDDVSLITTKEVSSALGVIEINECANVSAVATAVAEGSNEVGTVYKSDTTGFEDKLEILEVIPYELTGIVIYPAAGIVNEDRSEEGDEFVMDFIAFLKSDEAKKVFEKYYFDTKVD